MKVLTLLALAANFTFGTAALVPESPAVPSSVVTLTTAQVAGVFTS